MTYVVRDVLATKVEQRLRKVAVRHLERVVDTPKRSRKRVADARETTAGCCVRLEHHERLAPLLREHGRIKVLLDDTDARLMAQVGREHLKRILGRVVGVGENDCTVIAGVSVDM